MRNEKKQHQQPEEQEKTTGQPDAVYHVPVLLAETLAGLNIRPNGTYVDCTFGGGGHARAILEQLGAEGRLFVFDQDADARLNVPDDKRVVFIASNFRHLQRFLRLHKAAGVDGLLADLGVSSHQFDDASRGFSIRFDSDLDMRMDKRQTLTAAEVVNTYSEQQLHLIFERYGEVTNAKTLAKMIVQFRQSSPLRTSQQFRQTLAATAKGNPNRYFAQVFQALRIEVNDELGALKALLMELPAILKPGGRAVIITFHSLEDRIVKQFFRKGTFEEEQTDVFGQHTVAPPLLTVTKKPIIPQDPELKKNPRSRSAKLRIAEKTQPPESDNK